MPGRNEHKTVAAVTALTIEICRQMILYRKGIKMKPVDSILGLITAPVCGAIGGILPDIIEPAFDWNHRSCCHSVLVVASVALGTMKLPFHSDNHYFNVLNVGLRSMGVGHVTHILQDSMTPMGVPLIK